MARKVNTSPALARPGNAFSIESLRMYDIDLMRTLLQELASHASRINNSFPIDGTEPLTGPVVLAAYLKAALPSAVTWINGVIIVSDEIGGRTMAFSDGTNWRRVQDRNIVS